MAGSRRPARDREYIAKDSPLYADVFVDRLIGSAERLQEFPRSGRIVPEYADPDIREVIVGSYRIVYRLRGGAVEIATVFHSARPLALGDWSEEAPGAE